jgi:hypothetical protein
MRDVRLPRGISVSFSVIQEKNEWKIAHGIFIMPIDSLDDRFRTF